MSVNTTSIKQFPNMKIIISAFFATTFLFAFQNDPLQESIERGSAIYEGYCMACHLGTGEGVAGVYPPLATSDYLLEKTEKAIRAVKYGQQGAITVNGETYNSYMPAPGLDDREVADVMNYILNTWGNKYDAMITAEQVAAVEE